MLRPLTAFLLVTAFACSPRPEDTGSDSALRIAGDRYEVDAKVARGMTSWDTHAAEGFNLRKYEADGHLAWEKRIPLRPSVLAAAPRAPMAAGLSQAPDGVWVYGLLKQPPDPSSSSAADPGQLPFLAKVDGEGNLVSQLELGPAKRGPESAWLDDVVVAADGSIRLHGRFQGSLELPGMAVSAPSTGSSQRAIAKLDATGKALWVKKMYGTEGSGFAVTPAGEVYVSGKACHPDFGDGPIPTGDSYLGQCLFVAKFDAGGQQLWARGTNHDNSIFDQLDGPMVLLSDGGIAIAGTYDAADSDPLNFGGGALPRGQGLRLFVVRYDAEGHHLWSDGFQPQENHDLHSVRLNLVATPSDDLRIDGIYNHDTRELLRLDGQGVPQ